MTTEENATGTPQPRLDAEAVILKILELISTSNTIANFTPERLTEATGLQMNFDGSNRYGAGEKLTSEWSYGFYVNRAAVDGPVFIFSFDPNERESLPASAGICKTSLSRFSSEMEGMGFGRETNYGEHGMIISYLFRRHGLTVSVSTIGSSNASADNENKECVNMIVIR